MCILIEGLHRVETEHGCDGEGRRQVVWTLMGSQYFASRGDASRRAAFVENDHLLSTRGTCTLLSYSTTQLGRAYLTNVCRAYTFRLLSGGCVAGSSWTLRRVRDVRYGQDRYGVFAL